MSNLDATHPFRRIDWDMVERVSVVLLLGLLAGRLVPGVIETGNLINLLLLVSEAMAALFVLFRRRSVAISDRGVDWVLGFAGTIAPLLAIAPAGEPLIARPLCGALMLLGFAVQLWAKLTLRRSYGLVAANRGVKAGGPYRLVRHPMYAGYVATHIGFLLSGPTIWNAGIYALALALFTLRIRAEERVLRADEAYRLLASRVRWRLLPFVY
jgi:protein-S-isoprenylcysteine O-methyltransferase Ste14